VKVDSFLGADDTTGLRNWIGAQKVLAEARGLGWRRWFCRGGANGLCDGQIDTRLDLRPLASPIYKTSEESMTNRLRIVLSAIALTVALSLPSQNANASGGEQDQCHDLDTSCGTGCTLSGHAWDGQGACYTGKSNDLPTWTGDHCGTHLLSDNSHAHTAC
jgi:hypothetical protein